MVLDLNAIVTAALLAAVFCAGAICGGALAVIVWDDPEED